MGQTHQGLGVARLPGAHQYVEGMDDNKLGFTSKQEGRMAIGTTVRHIYILRKIMLDASEINT